MTSQQWRTEVAKRVDVRLRGVPLYWSYMHCCDWSAENELFCDTFILLVWIFHVQLFADCSLTWCVAGWRHFKQSDFKFLSTLHIKFNLPTCFDLQARIYGLKICEKSHFKAESMILSDYMIVQVHSTRACQNHSTLNLHIAWHKTRSQPFKNKISVRALGFSFLNDVMMYRILSKRDTFL